MPETVALIIAFVFTVSATSTAVVIASYAITAGILFGLSYGISLLTAQNFDGQSTGSSAVTSNLRSEVEPARWVLGTARVGGVLLFGETDGAELRLIFAVGQGSMQELIKVYVDEQPQELEKQVVSGRTTYAPKATAGHPPGADHLYQRSYMMFQPFFSPAAREAADWSVSSAYEDFPATFGWTDAHRARDLSLMYIRLVSPSYARDKPFSERLYDRPPNFHFLVRGLQITWPGQSTPTWTDNAAAIRFWWMTERRGIPASAIDRASFDAAFALCEENIYLNLPSEYADFRQVDKRYTIDGVILATDDVARVEAEMDFAWQGFVVESGGRYFFRPGADRPATWRIGPGDIVRSGDVQVAPAFGQVFNSARMTLAQSSEHEFRKYSVPTQTDADAVARHGQTLERDLGTRPFVSGPITAARLLAVQLRRSQLTKTFSYRLKPGENLEFWNMLPADRVLITDPNYGLVDQRTFVDRIVLNADMTLDVTLVEDADNIHVDTLVLPPLKPVEAA